MTAAEGPSVRPPRIFISYRRSDSQAWAGRLGQALADAFGDVARFFDIESIPAGENFADAIQRAVSTCQVLLALMGPAWLEAKDGKGRRRLDDPADMVRLEIAAALGKGITVIPVLLGRAQIPKADELPSEIRELVLHQALELSETRWQFDCERLIGAIERSTSLRRVDAREGAGGAHVRISVLENAEIGNSKIGKIVGAEGKLAGAPTEDTSIDVARRLRVFGSDVGSVAGVDVADTSSERE